MKKKKSADDGVRTDDYFGRADVIRKCYIFLTKPSTLGDLRKCSKPLKKDGDGTLDARYCN